MIGTVRDRTFYVLAVATPTLGFGLRAACSAWQQSYAVGVRPSLEVLDLWLGNWSVRVVPLAAVAAMVAALLLTVAAPRLLMRVDDAGELLRRAWTWLVVSMVSGALLMGTMLSARQLRAGFFLAVPLVWSAFVSSTLVLAHGCQAQRLLKESGASRLGGTGMIIVSLALQLLALPVAWALAMVALVRARRDQSVRSALAT